MTVEPWPHAPPAARSSNRNVTSTRLMRVPPWMAAEFYPPPSSRGKIASVSLRARKYPEAVETFQWSSLWNLVDGDRGSLNLGHECVDRWRERGTALRL